MVEGKTAFLISKGNTIIEHMEFIWIMALDYATIIYGWDLYGSEIMGRFQEIKTKVKLKTNRFEIKNLRWLEKVLTGNNATKIIFNFRGVINLPPLQESRPRDSRGLIK